MDSNLSHTKWNCKYYKAIEEYIRNHKKEYMISNEISTKEEQI